MTHLGKYLESTGTKSRVLWNIASTNFANQARGMAYSIQNINGLAINSTYGTIEYGILTSKSINIITAMVSDGILKFMQ